MAPSNSRKTITRPLRMRPSKRADFETGTVSAISDMARSVMDCDALPLGRTGGAKSDRGQKFLSHNPEPCPGCCAAPVSPLTRVFEAPLHLRRDALLIR